MPLLPQDAVESIDRKLAGHLRDIVARLNRLARGFKLSNWENDFRLLRAAGHSVETIQKVLDWYSREAGKTYTPQAFSGKSFRRKFPRLQELACAGDMVVTERANAIADRLRDHSCVESFRDRLPQVVQSGLDAVDVVTRFLQAWVDAPNGRYANFAAYILGQLEHSAFLVESELSYQIVHMAADGLDPCLWVFRPSSRMFSRLFADASVSFTGTAEMGESLYRKLLSHVQS